MLPASLLDLFSDALNYMVISWQAEGEQYGHPAVCFFTVLFKVSFWESDALLKMSAHSYLTAQSGSDVFGVVSLGAMT